MVEHAGHRRRLLARLAEGTLCEHEYLETLLFYAIPRRNTNDIAHRLLSQFKDINGVLNASPEELKKIDGIGDNAAAFLTLLGIICSQYRPYSIADGQWPVSYERESFLAFVKAYYKKYASPYEWLDVYLIDSAGDFYGCRRFNGRNLGKILLSPDSLGELIAREMPSGLVFVHNHPSATPKPSSADDLTTKKITELCNLHGVLLCDHVIYARDGIYSYFKAGKLKSYAK